MGNGAYLREDITNLIVQFQYPMGNGANFQIIDKALIR